MAFIISGTYNSCRHFIIHMDAAARCLVHWTASSFEANFYDILNRVGEIDTILVSPPTSKRNFSFANISQIVSSALQ